MATDATGTPTSLGIPTYLVAVDAPSGLGFNAAMAIIDTLIANRLVKPSGIAAGETSVYDGANFVRSSTIKLASGNFGPAVNTDIASNAAISVSKLAAGTTGQILTTVAGVPTWTAAGSSTNYATTLPASPIDGQEAVLVDSLTVPTYQWKFRWNAGSANTDKWEFVGGTPIMTEGSHNAVTGTSYVDLGTSATFTVPRAGVYKAFFNATASPQAGFTANIALKRGASATVDADSYNNVIAQQNYSTGSRSLLVTGLSASDVLKLQVKASTGGGNLQAQCALTVVPIRVS